jgi:DNA-3-methyladenine glycosylase
VTFPPPLPRPFYTRSPVDLAPALIGTLLCHMVDGELLAAVIVETEAYLGPADRASHARAGRTRRTAPMFGPPGHAYVYRLYGMHWVFNVVAHREDEEAGAVLVRAALPVVGTTAQRRRRGRPHDRTARLAAGPARLCQALGIVGEESGLDLTLGPPLWIAAVPAAANSDHATPDHDPSRHLVRGPRVNVTYAGEPWSVLPYRFGLAGSAALSRPFPVPTLRSAGRTIAGVTAPGDGGLQGAP